MSPLSTSSSLLHLLSLLLLSAGGDGTWTGDTGSFVVDDKTMYPLDPLVSEFIDECCCWL